MRNTKPMGSFTELTLALTFAPETPLGVLSAFAQWQTGDETPELPPFEDLPDVGTFDADNYLDNFYSAPPVASLPLLHRAATWRWLLSWTENAYFPGTAMTALRWDGQRWTLTTRTLPKESGEWVQAIIEPLGEWAVEGSSERPRFVGYVLDEWRSRPVLIWSAGREPFRLEGRFDGT
jgi:hypothetical protein